MPKLSILIAAHDEALLEASLVSVLQNRPADCEIVVVHDDHYQDPYDLAGEVHFVPAPATSKEPDRLNQGLRHCRGTIIHVLRCGAEVTDGWTDAALAHFADPCVAAVAPLLLTADRRRIVAAGIDYRAGGQRIDRYQKTAAAEIAVQPQPVLGPTLAAAFYRASALGLLREAFCPAVGEEFADVDLALRLARAGYRAVIEPSSRVTVAPAKRANPLAEAWLAERLFWRHARQFGVRGFLAHLRLLAVETTTCLLRPLRIGCVLGRATGLLERGLRGVAESAPPSEPPTTTKPPRLPAGLRVDEGLTVAVPQRPRRQGAPRVA